MVGILTIAPVSCDFNRVMLRHYGERTMLQSRFNGVKIIEYPHHHVRCAISANIEIMGLFVHKTIPDTPADNISFIIILNQSVYDSTDVSRYLNVHFFSHLSNKKSS